jgi:hypothetical protein
MREALLAIRRYARLILLDAAAVVAYSPVAELLNVEAITGVFLVQAQFPQDQSHGMRLLRLPL